MMECCLFEELPYENFFQAANLVRSVDQTSQSRIQRTHVCAVHLHPVEIALGTHPCPPPAQWDFAARRLLLPAAMFGDSPHWAALATAGERSFATASESHSPRPPHGRSRQAHAHRSPRRA